METSENPAAADGFNDGTLENAGAGAESELALVPDFFVIWRRVLCQRDGTPRVFVKFAPHTFVVFYSAVPWVLLNVWRTGRKIQDPSQAAQFSDIEFVRQALMIFCFLSGLLYLPALHQAIRPETGTLAQMEIGTKRVLEARVRSLKSWKLLMLVPTCIIGLWTLFMGYVMAMMFMHITGISLMQGKGSESFVAWARIVPMAPCFFVSLGIGWPAAFSWFLALKVAVVLSHADVQKVVDCVKPTALSDDDIWCKQVAQPAIRLATHTMPQLSEYGNGVGLAALLCLMGSVASFIGVVHDLLSDADSSIDDAQAIQDGGTELPRKVVAMVGTALAPVLLAKDVAGVSSLCDTLVDAVNSLRLEWTSTHSAQQVHNRTYPLQCTLEKLNGGQGLGFCVWTRVIDKKALNMIALSVLSFFGTVIPLVLATLQDPMGDTRADNACLSVRECAMASSILSDAAWREGDCISRNMTVANLLEWR
jgi:hypothetical protein